MRRALAMLALGSGLMLAPPAHAGGPISHACDRAVPLTARQQDRLLRVADWVRAALDATEAHAAIVARSGMNLERFGLRYSHAAVALRDGLPTRWGVRQLYFACDERRPRLFDQGLAGFIGGVDELDVAYLSLLVLPTARGGAEVSASSPRWQRAAAAAPGSQGAVGDRLATAVADRRQALSLLWPEYSANAYVYGTLFQNCNQWLIELIGATWSVDRAAGSGQTVGLPAARRSWHAAAPPTPPSIPPSTLPPAAPSVPSSVGALTAHAEASRQDEPDLDALRSRRLAAQAWLQAEGFDPAPVPIDSHWVMAAAGVVPLVSLRDHPEDDRFALKLRVSLPRGIQDFVRRKLPAAELWRVCHTAARAVMRRGGTPLDAACTPAPGDAVLPLD
jgi:hypothetical protein